MKRGIFALMSSDPAYRPTRKLVPSYFAQIENPRSLTNRPRGIRTYTSKEAAAASFTAGLPSRDFSRLSPSFSAGGHFGIENRSSSGGGLSFIPGTPRLRKVGDAEPTGSVTGDFLGPHRRHFRAKYSEEEPMRSPVTARNGSEGVKTALSWS